MGTSALRRSGARAMVVVALGLAGVGIRMALSVVGASGRWVRVAADHQRRAAAASAGGVAGERDEQDERARWRERRVFFIEGERITIRTCGQWNVGVLGPAIHATDLGDQVVS